MSGKTTLLNELSVNAKAKVIGILPESKVRRRLMDMGITRGTEIIVEGKAPLGDPIEVKVRGYSLILRKIEAVDITVEAI